MSAPPPPPPTMNHTEARALLADAQLSMSRTAGGLTTFVWLAAPWQLAVLQGSHVDDVASAWLLNLQWNAPGPQP